jgi:hypothetical protein
MSNENKERSSSLYWAVGAVVLAPVLYVLSVVTAAFFSVLSMSEAGQLGEW